MKRTGALFVALLTAALCVFVLASCSMDPPPTVRINEAMSRNDTVFPDESGNYCDWIELYNPTDAAVALEGWSLTDDAAKPKTFVFPAYTLEPGQCLMLFADKSARLDPAAGVFHLPFSISKDGESLRLFDEKTHLVSVLHVPRMEPDRSFGIAENGSPAVLDVPTPGVPNDGTAVLPAEATALAEPEPEAPKMWMMCLLILPVNSGS